MPPISRLLGRPDFRQNPLRAIRRRLWWRIRWTLTSNPWVLTLDGSLKLRSPRCGAGALIYYQGVSEPETARLLVGFLRPGMTVLDLGSHLGEYTLLAARAVSPGGVVHAIEPDPRIYPLLVENVALNGFYNVVTHQVAVSETGGTDELVLRNEPSLSSLVPKRPPGGDRREPHATLLEVFTTTLDAFCAQLGRGVDLIKMDIEGAELEVLSGGTRLLDLPPTEAPLWTFECAPETLSRFGRSPQELIARFEMHGYTVLREMPGGLLTHVSAAAPPRTLANLIATKRPQALTPNIHDAKRAHQS